VTNTRLTTTFRNNTRAEFVFLKAARSQADLYSRGIAVASTSCCLVPLSEVHADDTGLIALLSCWRQQNSYAYPTRFPVTEGGTATWIRNVVLENTDRILFLIVDRHGHPLGHLGFVLVDNERPILELDNVARGVKDVEPGLMAQAVRTLLNWASQTLWPADFILRVLESNTHAHDFYRGLGFEDSQSQPLRLVSDGITERLVPLSDEDKSPADDHFLMMRYTAEQVQQPRDLILTAGPSISAREICYTADAIRSGWNTRWNNYLSAFEQQFSEYIGVRHALATSSGTGALHIALTALGIQPGDEVIVPDLTWVATANAVLYVGATPIFADVDPETWCLCPKSFESLITERTKAVMPVHLYGHPARMDLITEIATRHNLYVVEDAAPSIGAEVRGRRTGSFGDFAAFSFQGAKLAVTGEGGMLVTDDTPLYERARSIWDQGRQQGTFWIRSNGLKYKMANALAALGCAQLDRNDAMVEAKRRIFGWYDDGLRDVPNITLNREAAWARSIYWMSSVLLEKDSGLDREGFRAKLRSANIDTRPAFPAISQYPIWNRTCNPQPVAKYIGDRAVNLPSGVCLTEPEVAYICKTIREVIA
jgi:perosamine synthetase